MYVDKPAYSGWEKLRLREVVLTYPGLRPRKWQSQDSKPVFSIPKATLHYQFMTAWDDFIWFRQAFFASEIVSSLLSSGQ